MAKALYRKYRSKKLSEVVGQDVVTTTLQNALKKGQISHAYLLTGPRGTGKTSIARILAHEVNNLPYEDDSMHLDIIEIDAASNRRIDEIRDLREKVNLAPTSAKYKVYIIDEVHMLTREAFNALLKTLEEPPDHVIFILATTELHKLPETIISRTQRYGLKPISPADMLPHLRHIAEQEKIVVDDEALTAIANHANGGFRDAISLLDQARGIQKDIGIAEVEQMLGRAPQEQIEKCLNLVMEGDGYSALDTVSALIESGHSSETLANQLISSARQRLLSHSSAQSEKVLEFMASLLEVSRSSNPAIALELCILKNAGEQQTTPKPVEKVIHNSKELEKPKETEEIEPPKPTEKPPKISDVKPTRRLTNSNIKELWPEVLNNIKGEHNTLYGILRMAEFEEADDDILVLSFQFPFHMKRASEARHHEVITKTLKLISGKDYAIQFVKRTIEPSSEAATKAPPKKEESAELNTIRDVFGEAELLD